MKHVHPDATIPADMGFGANDLRTHVERKLDDHFGPQAERLFHHYLELCRAAEERGLHLIAWDCAAAAAHWRQVADDYNNGQLVAVEEVTC